MAGEDDALSIAKASEESNPEAFADALLDALGAKDPYTLAHSLRVRDYAVALGRACGWSPEDLAELDVSARLHDIGKLLIESSILRNTTSVLDPHGEEAIRQHPRFGVRILEGVFSFAIRMGVYHHHERMDGDMEIRPFGAYPRGTPGHLIHPYGRIIAIADAFDAMTSTRSYSKAMSIDEAVARLRESAGPRHDPGMVALFIEQVVPKIRQARKVGVTTSGAS